MFTEKELRPSFHKVMYDREIEAEIEEVESMKEELEPGEHFNRRITMSVCANEGGNDMYGMLDGLAARIQAKIEQNRDDCNSNLVGSWKFWIMKNFLKCYNRI